MCHGPWQYLHPSWRIPQLLQLFSCPFPMAVPSHELSTELTRGAWGTAAALPCTGGTGVLRAVQDIFPSKLCCGLGSAQAPALTLEAAALCSAGSGCLRGSLSA